MAAICDANNIHGHYVEPYAGGAAVALYLLINEHVKEVTINDIDKSIHDFWYSVLNSTDELCDRIKKTKISIPNWRKCKKIQANKEKFSPVDLGFSTFFLNRTNISGILNGGVIGGLAQAGEYQMSCRFNKEDLIQRIRKIAEYKKNIHLCNLDAIKLIKKMQKLSKDRNSIFYFDPPYYLKGQSLYINYYKHLDHEKVSEMIKNMKGARWLVSYDNTEEIKKMYSGYKKIEYSLLHTAGHHKIGKEVIFGSHGLIIPKTPVFC